MKIRSCLVLLWFVATTASAIDIDVPTGVQTPPATDSVPFGYYYTRMQQVYDASAFAALVPAGGGYITGLWFSVSSGCCGRSAFFQINFSTTSRPVDGLSSVFADNIGSDELVAYPMGDYSMPFTGSSRFPIPLSTPFFYNPSAGNLLMDIQVTSPFAPNDPTMPYTFPVSTDPNDTVSRVWGQTPFPGQPILTGTPDTIGLGATFSIRPVPEPSSTALALTALAIAAFLRPHRKQHKPQTLNRKE